MNYIILAFSSILLSFGFGQYDFSMEDLNTTSPSYEQDVNPSGGVSLVYFGHYN